ncbi:mammalian cell entry protein [Mycobacterium deserti]|uniref:Mammalian cell entry protein n=1 Tax=Mycobacterium deserti TaxID=2978347 RepID=A0ABT2MEJ0_9MYCO|nr:mammalian cell entry protein [Mycobacterium deserti]MCT7660687.1 mammalian cell entry protein [Mycobacterium deserti]
MTVDTDRSEADTSAVAPPSRTSGESRTKPRVFRPATPTPLIAGTVVVLVLAALVGWLGNRAYQDRRDEQQRAAFLQVARQTALNLTTIDHTRVDSDVQRILDSTTGKFHDEFRDGSPPFIEMVKQAQSTTQGTVTEAAIESADAGGAQVIVTLSVKTSTPKALEQEPRTWRMRIVVDKTSGSDKASEVQFVQ